MNKKEKHDYLITLIKELEKAGNNTNLNNFIIVLEDTLKTKYRLRDYLDYPISAAEYDELITYAENMLGVNDPHYENLDGVKYSGRTPEIETYSCFCINGSEVGSYTYNEHEGHYEFYDNDNQLLASIKSEPIEIKNIGGNEDWNRLASLFGDAECCVEASLSGRTNGATSAESAKSDIITDALVDKALSDKSSNSEIIKLIDNVRERKLDAATLEAIKKATEIDPSTLKTLDEVKKELEIDENETNYKKYWSKGEDAHFFYSDEYLHAWRSADLWHRDIYYWPYNEQIIVGQVNLVEWYKTKGDQLEWGPIFGPFKSPAELDGWFGDFWTWWHALSDKHKAFHSKIPHLDNNWISWGTDYKGMFEFYANFRFNYKNIIAEFPEHNPVVFSEEWNAVVGNFITIIKILEKSITEEDGLNNLTGRFMEIKDLEQKLLDFLKKTI